MSHSHECDAVIAKLYEFLDGECCEELEDEIRSHLDICDHCAEDAEVVLALKALVKRCCCQESAPASLRARITAQYACEVTVTVTSVEVTTIHRSN